MEQGGCLSNLNKGGTSQDKNCLLHIQKFNEIKYFRFFPYFNIQILKRALFRESYVPYDKFYIPR